MDRFTSRHDLNLSRKQYRRQQTMILKYILLLSFIFFDVSGLAICLSAPQFKKTATWLPSTSVLHFRNHKDRFRLGTKTDPETDLHDDDGIRLNKAFKSTHSRRQADRLIAEGRVRVNGVAPDSMAPRLFPGDKVTLDGKVVHWQRLNQNEDNIGEENNSGAAISPQVNGNKNSARRNGYDENIASGDVHTYIKYWKPRGIECTTDRRVARNIMDALGKIPSVTDRLFPMGRLDKDSTGLIIITSDGTTTQRVLRSETKKWKTYVVETDHRASDHDLNTLSNGVRILSPVQRDSGTKVRWVKTQTAIVERGPDVRKYPNQLVFKIFEGKNRQIRRMCEKVGLRVIRLHRIEFAGITLEGCPRPGCWAFLTGEEIQQLKTGGGR